MRRYHREILVCFFLIGSTLAVYLQVLNHTFVNFDDDLYVINNQHVQAGFTVDNFVWAFTSTEAFNWHPLTWLSHTLDFQLYGANFSGHHLTSLFLHIINTLFLFFVLARTTKSIWPGALVAALFALHPVHVESVAWLSERKDVLSTFFWLITIYAYVLYTEKRKLKRYFLTLTFFLLGLLSKPMIVSLPFVLLLLDYWPLRRFNFTKPVSFPFLLLKEKLPFFILSILSCIVTFIVQQNAVRPLEILPLKVRFYNVVMSYVSYIGKMIWPRNLAFFYPYPDVIPLWKVVALSLLLLGISLIVIWQIRRFSYMAVGWFWYLGTLVPVIGIVQVGEQSMADRYTYIPFIGLFIIIAWGFSDVISKWRYCKKPLVALTGVALIILIISSWFQVRFWRDSTTLFKHAISVTSNNYVAYNNLGLVMVGKGKLDEAISNFREALKIIPNYHAAYNNLGLVMAGKGKLDEAISNFREALKIVPNSAEIQYNLGTALLSKGENSAALYYFLKALTINPNYAEVHNNMGILLKREGKIDEAIGHFSKALHIKPNFLSARQNLTATLNSISEKN